MQFSSTGDHIVTSSDDKTAKASNTSRCYALPLYVHGNAFSLTVTFIDQFDSPLLYCVIATFTAVTQ